MTSPIAIWALLIAGFVLNLASAFTTAFARRWGMRTGQWVCGSLRAGLGMPSVILGIGLASHAPAGRLFAASAALHVLSGVLIGAGAGIILWALPAIGRRAAMPAMTDSLSATGPYAFVRHPVYTGTLLEFIGLAIAHPTGPFVSACAAGCLWLLVQARLEERDLVLRVADYAAYMRRVPRFLPRLTLGSPGSLPGG